SPPRHLHSFPTHALPILTGQHNGVSELHGAVSRKMWQFLWPGIDAEEVPIDSITNGIHTPSWIAPELNALFKRYLGEDWEDHVRSEEHTSELQSQSNLVC